MKIGVDKSGRKRVVVLGASEARPAKKSTRALCLILQVYIESLFLKVISHYPLEIPYDFLSNHNEVCWTLVFFRGPIRLPLFSNGRRKPRQVGVVPACLPPCPGLVRSEANCGMF